MTEVLVKLEKVLDEYFGKKAPALPKNVKEVLVKIAPYLTIAGIILSLPAILGILGMGSLIATMPYGRMGMGQVGYYYYLGIIFLVANVILEVMAVPGLLAKSKKGWNFVFYAVLLNAVYSLVSFNLGWLIVGTVLGFYFLFQVRSYYK